MRSIMVHWVMLESKANYEFLGPYYGTLGPFFVSVRMWESCFGLFVENRASIIFQS